MGKLEEYYLKKEADIVSTKISDTVRFYNSQVAYIIGLTSVVVKKIIANPPEDYSLVLIEGERHLAWPLLYHGNYRLDVDMQFYVLQDGELINTRYIDAHNIELIGYIYLQKINNNHEMFKSQDNYIGGGYDFEVKTLSMPNLEYLREALEDTILDLSPEQSTKEKIKSFFTNLLKPLSC